jgi:hypothetical protein
MKGSEAVMASEPKRNRQPSIVSHDEYAKAHATYSKMGPAKLRAHRAAVNDVHEGLAAASPGQLDSRLGRAVYD